LRSRVATFYKGSDMRESPEQLRHDEAVSFLAAALIDRPRVLDVGCGRGDIAVRLADSGFAVTALDIALRDPIESAGVTYIEHDFLTFEAEPFDAIVFGSSLHHIVPLERAIAKVTRLLRPTGRLIIDDFDVESPDGETLRWYYETQDLLAAADLFDRAHVDGTPIQDPETRWREAHGKEPLHTGAEMRHAISSRFVIRELRRGEYLYRYIAAGLPADARGARIATTVRASERDRIARGHAVPVGLRIVADRARLA
jgi:SAM-dependent methyltransferase